MSGQKGNCRVTPISRRTRSAPASLSETYAAEARTLRMKAALVLFLMDQGVTENRPLKLEIDYAGETGEITLDI